VIYHPQTDRFCITNGCQYRQMAGLAGEAQEMLEQASRERKTAMAGALWCDLGEHAFSARDRKRATFKIQTYDEDTGEPIEDDRVACGPHAAERQTALKPKAALPAGADAELYTEFLEWKNGIKPAPEMTEPS
jgi:hypothetical protein